MAEKPQPVASALLRDANANEADKVSDQLQSTSIAVGTASSVERNMIMLSSLVLKKEYLVELNFCGSSTSKPEEVKRLPGGKIKKKERQEVIIEKVVRNKRKSITTVKGLELFGVKLSDASKKLGKKFATGASVVKGPTEKEQIDVQGDISYDIVEFITETWPDVPEAAIFFIEDGKKVPAA
ncbi:translation initiation factor SUI1 family protein [Actinidia rufa]|uniref:Translation machinery-associated protein 22 n=1 Tax=Actinidia rufa TaxID=165716 RepID=A0A7J0FKM8_9ERIC|nr:translation initiation factor SUI1 family protein [Actinidia rufa]